MSKLATIIAAFTKTERILFFIAVAAAIAAGGALATMVVYRFTTVVPARGGTQVEGIVGQPTYVNPILAETDADKALVRETREFFEDLRSEVAAGMAAGQTLGVVMSTS